ncbi:MAG: DNA polymerase IV [Desulfovibrionales bacterium]
MNRTILHLDMDAFFASIEQMDNPEYKGKPVIVGNSSRGVVSAASYEARKFGVRSALPVTRARQLCPQGIFLPVRGKRYREISGKVMGILDTVSPLVERASVDEAYVDVTGTTHIHGPFPSLGRKIKDMVLEQTGLTCSIGIAPNKLLAKIASDWEKPDGLTVVAPERAAEFIANVPVQKIPGLGGNAGRMLTGMGVKNGADVLRFPLSFWESKLGRMGVSLHRKAQGVDNSPVEPFSPPKSCGAETTFSQDSADPALHRRKLIEQCERVGRALRRKGVRGRTVVLKLKYADFTGVTRSKTISAPTDCTNTIIKTALLLLEQLAPIRKVRLIGVSVTNFQAGPIQLLLNPEEEKKEMSRLDRAIDTIHAKYGTDVLKRGILHQDE